MASDSQNETKERDRLPFEPSKSRKKSETTTPKGEPRVNADKQTPAASASSSDSSLDAIPEAVSKRMLQRMGLFSGVPLFFGIASFFVSYFIVIGDVFPLPTSAVVLVSMGFFGLSVLGLSYGVLSASWEEEILGSKIGWEEFKVNFGRLTAAWREARDARRKG